MDVGRSTSDETLTQGTVVAGRYVVDEVIARTGLSVVYRVEHVHTGERLAMKVLGGSARVDPQAMQRFRQEVRTSSRIRSEHVVLVTDADTAPELDGAPFMVMELLHGADLETYALRRGPLPPEVVVPLLAQVASVLDQAHRQGIIHRDLKPENLFLHERPDGSIIAKVLDFGISKFVSPEEADRAISVTSTGAVLGTPLYMAPEQAHGKNDEIGVMTDVWAMGLIAMRLLTGEHYWGRPTMADLMVKITVAPLIAPSERWPSSQRMSPALDAWFLRSCERDRRKRWASAAEQMTELAAALDVPLPKSTSGALDRIELAPAPMTDAERAASTPIDADGERLGLDATERALPAEGAVATLASRAADARAVGRVDDALSRSVGAQANTPTRSRRNLAVIASALALVLVAAGLPWLIRRNASTREERGEASAVAVSQSNDQPSSRLPNVDLSSDASLDAAASPSTAIGYAEPRPLEIASAAPSSTGVVHGKSSEGQRPPPMRSAAPAASGSSSKGVDSVASCGEGEVLSFGRCCPSGHVWQSGRCARPVATTF